jgi:hypothetical protein
MFKKLKEKRAAKRAASATDIKSAVTPTKKQVEADAMSYKKGGAIKATAKKIMVKSKKK